MTEYINKERLLRNDAICKDISCSDCPFDDDINDFRCKLIRYIDDMPTTEIVHCSECIHRREFEEYNRTHNSFDLCVECEIDGKYHDDDWFCADGERRTND